MVLSAESDEDGLHVRLAEGEVAQVAVEARLFGEAQGWGERASGDAQR